MTLRKTNSLKKGVIGQQCTSNHIFGPSSCQDIKYVFMCGWALLGPDLIYMHICSLQCQIVRGVKLSAVSNCPGVKLSPNRLNMYQPCFWHYPSHMHFSAREKLNSKRMRNLVHLIFHPILFHHRSIISLVDFLNQYHH